MPRNITGKIVSALNESINDQAVENERTVGVNIPKQVHQCENCAEFYLTEEATNESVCPHCGGEGKPVGDVTECGAGQISSKEIIDENEEEELKSEAELVVSEALSSLDRNDYKKFNECYRPRVRMTAKGELQAIVESTNGGHVTASRRMTSRQKTAYNLAEKYTPATASSSSSKKNEAVKLSRQNLMIKNESRALKIQACRLLERQGAKYDFKKFNEGMDKFINSRRTRQMLESIAEDDEIGKSELDTMTPDEIGDAVTSVVKDTGLEVVANDVDIDGETATVNVRVEDNDEQEVRTSELEATLGEVFDAPVEIVGPYESEGDKSIADLAVVINPDNSVNEDDPDENPLGEGFDEDGVPNGSTLSDPGPNGLDLQVKEGEEDPKNPESTHKFENYRSRSKSNRKNLKEGLSKRSLFALQLNESARSTPKFLAHDDSLVEGYEDDAEDKARLFVSEDAANKFLEDAGLDSEFTPKSITIISEDDNLEDPDPSVDKITEDGADVVQTDDGKFFKKDECFYKENLDGTVQEIDESEYEDAVATADAEKLKESYLRRRGRK